MTNGGSRGSRLLGPATVPPSRGQPLLTACLIVRDEASLLPGCLESLAGVADEIVVVDTGSRDGTAALAAQVGARVLSRPWREDFGWARNEALAAARGSWVLSIDADERLRAPDGSAAPARDLRLLLREGAASGHHLWNRSLASEDGRLLAVELVPRLFRRVPGARFVHSIHEYPLLPDGHHWAPTELVELLHLGYIPDLLQRRQKHARNLRLLEAAVARAPGDAYLRFHLGHQLGAVGRWDEALPHLAAAVGASGMEHLPGALDLATALGRLGLFAEADEHCRRLVVHHPAHPDAWLAWADVLARAGRPRDALFCALRCIGLQDQPRSGGFRSGRSAQAAWAVVGGACEDMGETERALAAYWESVRLWPDPIIGARLERLLAARALPAPVPVGSPV